MSGWPTRRRLISALPGLSLLALPDIGVCAAPPEKLMTTILRVNLVLSIHDTQVETDRSGILVCTDPRMQRDLAFYLSRRLPASLAFDESARELIAVGSAPTDRLLVVEEPGPAADRISVQLMKRPSLLYLARANPRFAELHATLQGALSEKQTVAIGVLPAGHLIEDVRVNDWQPR